MRTKYNNNFEKRYDFLISSQVVQFSRKTFSPDLSWILFVHHQFLAPSTKFQRTTWLSPIVQIFTFHFNVRISYYQHKQQTYRNMSRRPLPKDKNIRFRHFLSRIGFDQEIAEDKLSLCIPAFNSSKNVAQCPKCSTAQTEAQKNRDKMMKMLKVQHTRDKCPKCTVTVLYCTITSNANLQHCCQIENSTVQGWYESPYCT